MMRTIEKPNILLVDDRPENLEVLVNLLEEFEANFLRATSGNQALEIALKHEFALVLMDVQMPKMNGYETGEIMRSRNKTPLIFMTTTNQVEAHIFQGYGAGAVDYLFKPINPHILKSKVNIFIELDQQRKQLKLLNQDLEERVNERTNELERMNEVLFDLPEPDSPPEKAASPERLNSFVQDALEHLETAEDAFLVLDKLGGDIETTGYLQSAFRSFHTIKGNAGFLSLAPIERLSHKAETILETMQEETIPVDASSIQMILEIIDTLREGTISLSNEETLDLQRFEQAERRLAALASDQAKLGKIMVEMGTITPEDVEEAVQQQRSPLGDLLVRMGKASSTDVEKALKEQSKSKPAPPTVSKTQDIRVNLSKLDQLIELVGELVISEAMISHHPALERTELESLKNASGQLNRNMRDLQEITMSMRMVPVSSLFRKMIRVVHDSAKKLGKQVELELVGEQTEVDKTLVEQIADPLLHIIRNAVDHGMEMPEERQAAGKPASGSLLLEARHVGSEVWIVAQDDGKGLNREKILDKAQEKGLISSDASPPDEEVWKLILEPGFSTAEVVTDFSGRGVGMDVVKKNIEKLGGTIDIRSKIGEGSVFTLRVPLTLSIIDSLLVQVGEVFYALPTTAVRETLRPQAVHIKRTMDGSEMLRIRQKLLPILRLHTLYKIQPETTELSEGMLLVIEQADRLFCLFVDAVIGQQQVVVKSLPESMTQVPHLAGCTILGDGQIGLILDAASLTKIVTYRKNKTPVGNTEARS